MTDSKSLPERIWYVLMFGTREERERLLWLIERLCGKAKREAVERQL